MTRPASYEAHIQVSGAAERIIYLQPINGRPPAAIEVPFLDGVNAYGRMQFGKLVLKAEWVMSRGDWQLWYR